MMQIDRSQLVSAMNACFGVVKYRMGAKPRLGAKPGPGGFTTADCSGWVRWLLNAASGGTVALPLGSYHQRAWVESHGYHECPYSDCSLSDSRLRVAFIRPKPSRAGHVWLTISGKTIESCGGRGACRRSWNTPILLKHADACYVLTDPLP